MAKTKDLILQFDEFDVNHVVADLEEIRKHNHQRFEMEQLTAVCYEDAARGVAVGYKDLAPDEFWVRGHMPGAPLLPGVLTCEIAAQLCSFLAHKHGLLGTDGMLGFGGMNDVRFRGVVPPGKRVVVMVRMLKIRKGVLMTCQFQAFVDRDLVAEGEILGVALPPAAKIRGEQDSAGSSDGVAAPSAVP